MEKMEPGSDNEPDLSVRTSVAKRSLSFNTSIMKDNENAGSLYMKQFTS